MATFTGNGTGSDMYGYMHARVVVTRTDNSNGTTCSVKVECYAVSDGGSSSFISGRASNNEACTTWTSYSSEKSVSANATVLMTSATFTVNRTTSQKTITCRAQIAGGGTGMYNGTSDTASVSVTIPALASYTVSYNANGGSGAPGNQTKYHGQTLTLSSTTPTRSGYSFKNWNTAADGSGTTYNAGSNYTGNTALTLYAQWTVDYEPPVISNISIIRCDSSGQEQDKGTYAKATANWSVDSTVTGNTLTFSYKETSASSYTSIGSVTLSGTSGQANSAIFGGGNLDLNKTYSVKVELTDTKPTTVTKYGTVPVGFVTLEFLNGGTGFAIGKSAKVANKIETTLPIKIQSTNITDGTAPAEATFTERFYFSDSSNNTIGISDSFFDISGWQYQRLLAQRKIGNNTYHNAIYLGIGNVSSDPGTPIISLLNDENKKAWQEALEPDVLFEGQVIPPSTASDTLKLSSSAANYNHMRIYYRYYSTSMPRGSVEVFEPNGKSVNLFIGYAGLNSGLYWPSGVDIYINGQYITRRYSFYTSSSTTTVRTTAAGGDTSPIYITRVEAWNDAWW